MENLPSVGDEYSNSFVITEEKVLDFAKVSGDYNPVHIIKAEARDYGFNKPVCHGAILLSEISRIIGMELPGKGAFWTNIESEFLQPVFWDDKVIIYAKIIQVSEALNMMRLELSAFVKDKMVFSGTCKAMILKKILRRNSVPIINERTALVTGGSRGLGLSICTELLNVGYKVISISRNPSTDLEELLQKFPTQFQTIYEDLKNETLVNEKLESLDKDINIIIHAASPNPVKRSLNTEIYDDVIELTDVYLKGLINISNFLIPKMKKKKYGRIITIGTSFMLGAPPIGMYSYIIAKEALWGLTKSLGIEFGKYGITSNMVSPGMMITEMTSDIPNALKVSEANSNPIKRLVEPDEVAKTIEFLCSDRSTFINASNIPLNGGIN